MPVPTLTKSWHFDVNQLILAQGSLLETYRALVLSIKNTLISRGLWTVIRSSNAVTVGNSDLWTSSSDLNWNNNGSWIVLRNASISNCEILLNLSGGASFNSAQDYRYYIDVRVSPFGFNLDGNATTLPTSNYSVMWQQLYPFLAQKGNVPSYLNIMQSQDGECTRIMIKPQGSTNDVIVIMIEKINSHLNSSMLYSPISFVYDRYPIYYSYSNSAKIILNNPLTSTPTILNPTLCSLKTNFGGYVPAESNSTYTNSYIISNYGLFNSSHPNRGRLGVFQDLWFKSKIYDSINTGFYTCYVPSGISKSFVQVYDYLFPWNGTTFLSA